MSVEQSKKYHTNPKLLLGIFHGHLKPMFSHVGLISPGDQKLSIVARRLCVSSASLVSTTPI